MTELTTAGAPAACGNCRFARDGAMFDDEAAALECWIDPPSSATRSRRFILAADWCGQHARVTAVAAPGEPDHWAAIRSGEAV